MISHTKFLISGTNAPAALGSATKRTFVTKQLHLHQTTTTLKAHSTLTKLKGSVSDWEGSKQHSEQP